MSPIKEGAPYPVSSLSNRARTRGRTTNSLAEGDESESIDSK